MAIINLKSGVVSLHPHNKDPLPSRYALYPQKGQKIVFYHGGNLKYINFETQEEIFHYYRALGGGEVYFKKDSFDDPALAIDPTPEQVRVVRATLTRLDEIAGQADSAKPESIDGLQSIYGFSSVNDIIQLLKGLKTQEKQKQEAQRLHELLGDIGVVSPAVSPGYNFVVYSVEKGCDNGCGECPFPGKGELVPETEEGILAQHEAYKEILGDQLGNFHIFLGNLRGLGIDFEHFKHLVQVIRQQPEFNNNTQLSTFACVSDIPRIGNGLSDLLRLGVVDVNVGYESGSEIALKALGKRQHVADMRAASRIFSKTGVRYSVNLMVGGEWDGHVERTLQFFSSDTFEGNANKPKIYISRKIGSNKEVCDEQSQRLTEGLGRLGFMVSEYLIVPFT